MTQSSPNPFDNPEFRKELSALLDEKIGEMKSKVEEHDDWINQQKGGGAILRHLYTVIVAAVSGIIAGWFGRH